MQKSGGSERTKNSDSAIQFLPTSFIRSGSYRFDSGSLIYYPRGDYGLLWGVSPNSTGTAKSLYFGPTGLGPQVGIDKGYGFSIRCLVR